MTVATDDAPQLSFRKERLSDVVVIADVVKRAYEHVTYSDHREHLMIDRLRATSAFVPELSLLAEANGHAAGHVLLTRILIRGQQGATASLALAPLSIVPEWQGRRVGTRLVAEAHDRARRLGFGSVVVVGMADFYRRLGYASLGIHSIELPFAARSEDCSIAILAGGALAGVSGTLEYPPEWMSH